MDKQKNIGQYNRNLQKAWADFFKSREQEKYARAVYELNSMLMEFPDEKRDIVKFLGIVYWEAEENRYALRYLKRAARYFPKSSVISICLIYSLWDLGFKTAALEQLEHFLKIDPAQKEHIEFLNAIGVESGEGKHFTLALDIHKLHKKYIKNK